MNSLTVEGLTTPLTGSIFHLANDDLDGYRGPVDIIRYERRGWFARKVLRRGPKRIVARRDVMIAGDTVLVEETV